LYVRPRAWDSFVRVRVVAGQYGGRVLRAPRGAATRPTSEKVREAVFAILPDVANATVLDLFAGSGAVGIEALSRGAARATFVDAARAARMVIEANLATLDLGARATVVGSDAVAFAAAATGPFDAVFVDPPYASDLAARAVAALRASALAADAVVVVEHDRRHDPGDELGAVTRTDHRRYGDTLVSFYRLRAGR
jgi:16S rRNA (guanine966-N2)-methyltransferase